MVSLEIEYRVEARQKIGVLDWSRGHDKKLLCKSASFARDNLSLALRQCQMRRCDHLEIHLSEQLAKILARYKMYSKREITTLLVSRTIFRSPDPPELPVNLEIVHRLRARDISDFYRLFRQSFELGLKPKTRKVLISELHFEAACMLSEFFDAGARVLSVVDTSSDRLVAYAIYEEISHSKGKTPDELFLHDVHMSKSWFGKSLSHQIQNYLEWTYCSKSKLILNSYVAGECCPTTSRVARSLLSSGWSKNGLVLRFPVNLTLRKLNRTRRIRVFRRAAASSSKTAYRS